MATTTITIKRNDTYPPLTVQFLDSSNNPVDLTHATVNFSMKSSTSTSTTVKISKAAVEITNATQGRARYNWVSGDTNTIDTYKAEFEIVFDDGTILTVPNNDYITIKIIRDL